MVLKGYGYHAVKYADWGLPVFVRDQALLIMLVPVGWCYWSIRWEEQSLMSQRGSLTTGVLLLFLLGWMMFVSWGKAFYPAM